MKTKLGTVVIDGDKLKVQLEGVKNPTALIGVPDEVTLSGGDQVVVEPTDQGQRFVREANPPSTAAEPERPADKAGNPQANRFVYPANFVPFLDSGSAVGTDDPWGGVVGHDSLRPDRWSGTLAVTATVATPVLLPDPMTAKPQKPSEGDGHHFTYGLARVGNEVVVTPTAIRGPLRALYEAATNSRVGVWSGWDQRLGYRTPASGENLQPCRLRETESGWVAEVFPRVAFLPFYGHRGGGNLPTHGQELSLPVVTASPRNRPNLELDYVSPGGTEQQGIAIITGNNARGKKHERFAFGQPAEHNLTDDQVQAYRELLDDYLRAHPKEDLTKGSPGDNIKEWSAHLSDPSRREIATGHLCFARMENGKIVNLQPVMISRRLYDLPPVELLPESLRPARSIGELSPADRVFGWVDQHGSVPGAYASNLRIGPVAVAGANGAAVGPVDVPEAPTGGAVALAELASPKPSSARVYAASDGTGKPLGKGSKREVAFRKGMGLRGRKFYVAQPPGRWSHTHNNGARGTTTKRNRSVSEALLPGATLSFDISFRNLSTPELGALVWCIHHLRRLRIGFAKPLGFGTLNLQIDHDRSDLRGPTLATRADPESPADAGDNAHRARYASLRVEPQPPTAEVLDGLIGAYHHALSISTNDQGNLIRDALVRIHHPGTDNPVRYPLVDNSGNADTRGASGYQWFVNNERIADKKSVARAVPSAAHDDDLSLPLAPGPDGSG